MLNTSKNGSVMMNYYRGLCAEKTTPFDLYGKISATNIAFATVELKSCKQLEKDTESATNAWIQPIGVGGWGSRFSPSGTDRGYLQTAVSCVAWEGGRIVTETVNTLLNNVVLPVVNMTSDGLSWSRNGVTSLFTYAMTPTDYDAQQKKDLTTEDKDTELRKLATKNNEIVLTDIGELVLAAYIRLYNTIEPLVKPSLGQIKSWKPYGQRIARAMQMSVPENYNKPSISEIQTAIQKVRDIRDCKLDPSESKTTCDGLKAIIKKINTRIEGIYGSKAIQFLSDKIANKEFKCGPLTQETYDQIQGIKNRHKKDFDSINSPTAKSDKLSTSTALMMKRQYVQTGTEGWDADLPSNIVGLQTDFEKNIDKSTAQIGDNINDDNKCEHNETNVQNGCFKGVHITDIPAEICYSDSKINKRGEKDFNGNSETKAKFMKGREEQKESLEEWKKQDKVVKDPTTKALIKTSFADQYEFYPEYNVCYNKDYNKDGELVIQNKEQQAKSMANRGKEVNDDIHRIANEGAEKAKTAIYDAANLKEILLPVDADGNWKGAKLTEADKKFILRLSTMSPDSQTQRTNSTDTRKSAMAAAFIARGPVGILHGPSATKKYRAAASDRKDSNVTKYANIQTYESLTTDPVSNWDTLAKDGKIKIVNDRVNRFEEEYYAKIDALAKEAYDKTRTEILSNRDGTIPIIEVQKKRDNIQSLGDRQPELLKRIGDDDIFISFINKTSTPTTGGAITNKKYKKYKKSNHSTNSNKYIKQDVVDKLHRRRKKSQRKQQHKVQIKKKSKRKQ